MRQTNEGWDASPRTLLLLAERGIHLSLDIYDPTLPGGHPFNEDDERVDTPRVPPTA